MNTEEKIKVMQAYVDGKPIQAKHAALPGNYNGSWEDVVSTPIWNWEMADYRIKPEPKVIWVNECKKPSMRHDIAYQDKNTAIEYAALTDDVEFKRIAVKYVEAPKDE